MASSAGHPGPVSNATYWRRRVFLLVGLLAVLTLIAFACRPSSDEEGDATNSASTESSEESQHPDEESPDPSIPASEPPDDGAKDGADDDAGNGDEAAGDGAGTAGGPGAAAGGDAGSGGSGTDSEPGGDGRSAPRREDLCHPDDVVVTLRADDTDYGSGQEPEFTLTVVSTAPGTCVVDVGGEALEVRITSGDDRIWSTADCAGDADHERLSRGVPYLTTVTWERVRSWPDCRDRVVNARPGTYVARLHSEYEGAEARVFRLN